MDRLLSTIQRRQGAAPDSLRIAHITTTFDHRAAGASRLFKRLRALADHGYRVLIVSGRDCDPHPDWNMEGIPIHRVESLVKYIHPLKDARALYDLWRTLRRLRPHTVHTHMAKAGILGRWAARLCKTPIIFHTVRGPTFSGTLPFHRRAIYRTLEWATGRITDHFVFVGENLRREYVQNRVCRYDNSVIVRTGRPDCEIEELFRIGEEDLSRLRDSFLRNGDEMLIVNVGRVVPSKRQEHAIRVVRELRERGVKAHLALVGEGLLKEEKGYLAYLKDLTDRLGMAPHVTFTGHRDDALRIMAASDAILHTSRYEGLPNILVEGALAGRPVVTYSVSGAREVIRDGKTGFIVEQGDIQGAVQRLLELARQPLKAREMGLRARLCVSDQYRESRMIRSKVEFYNRVLGSPGKEGKGYAGPSLPSASVTHFPHKGE